MSTATQEARQVGSALPQGGGYSADQNPDGSWNVRDVPVFAAHKREGMPRVTRVWLERAVARAQADKASGYIPPLHVAHHNTGQPVKAAGKFLLTRVADFAFAGGAPRPTVFADFLGVSQETYDDIKAGKLPYRSIEAADLRVCEINSIALLDHDAPFFKFPLLSIGSERPAVQARAAGARFNFNINDEDTMRVHYSAGGKPVTGKAALKAKFDAGVADAMAKAQEAAAGALAAFTETLNGITESVASMAADLGLADGASEAPAEEAPEEAPVEADADAEDPEKKDEDMKPAEAPKAMAASAGALPAGLPTEFKAQFAAMQGRLRVLEGEAAKTKKDTARATAIASATKDLAGYAGDFTKDLGEAFDLGGAPNVALYVRSVKAMGLQAPPETFTGDLPAPNEPAEVAAYAMAGQTKLREARRMAAIYSDYPQFRGGASLANYLATQVGPPPSAPSTPSAPATPGRS